MILLIEPDKAIRKKLCDLLSRERIIGVDSVQQTLEMILKFKNNINVIIANIRLLRKILSNQIIFRLCEKLSLKTPPIVGFYKKNDEEIKKEFEKNNKQYKLIEYNEKDYSFPGQYIQAIKEVYPELTADIEKAREVWLKEKETEDLVDLRKWFEEEDFLEIIKNLKIGKPGKDTEHIIPSIEEMTAEKTVEKKEEIEEINKEKNYKKMYFELKKKHDELLRYVKELIDSIKDTNN